MSRIQRRLSVPGLREGVDITSCGRQKCLYVADGGRSVVHRVCPGGGTTVWSLNDKPTSLSVTRSAGCDTPRSAAGNLLVTFSASGMLRQYSPDGRLVRQIKLEPDLGMLTALQRSFSSR